jgi:hypothetical protein
MKKILIIFVATIFFSSCITKEKFIKGQILFDMDWKAQTLEKGPGYFWIVPVQVGNDTLHVNYLDTDRGVRDIITSKILYDLGYLIEKHPQIAHLGANQNTANDNLSIEFVSMK